MAQVVEACSNHWTAIVAGLWLIHSVFEYWVGKTEKVKSGSMWELILTGILQIVILIAKRSNSNGNRN